MKLKTLLKKYQLTLWHGANIKDILNDFHKKGVKSYSTHITNSFYIGQYEEKYNIMKIGIAKFIGKRISSYNQGGCVMRFFVRIDFFNEKDIKKIEDSFKKIWKHRNINNGSQAKELYNFKHHELDVLAKWLKTYCKVNNIKIKEEFLYKKEPNV